MPSHCLWASTCAKCINMRVVIKSFFHLNGQSISYHHNPGHRTIYNDFLRWIVFFFLSLNTHVVLPMSQVGFFPDAPSSSQTMLTFHLPLSVSAVFPLVPQSLTLPLDLYHKSFPPSTSPPPPTILPPLPLTASKSPINPLLGSILLLNNWKCLLPQWKGL